MIQKSISWALTSYVTNTLIDAKFNWGSRPLVSKTGASYSGPDAKHYHDYHCLYSSVFSLPVIVFLCSIVSLETCLNFLSNTFNCSSIKKLMSNIFLFVFSVCSSILDWPVILFLPVASSWGLVAFLLWRHLITSSSSKLLTKSLTLLLNMFDNGLNSYYNFLLYPNAYFNICFRNIVRIFLFYLTWLPTQLSPIWI